LGWQELYRARRVKAEAALAKLRSGSGVFIGSGCGEPRHLVASLARRAESLRDVAVIQAVSVASQDYTADSFAQSLRAMRYFVAAGARQEVSEGRADYTPIYLSDLPGLIERRRLKVDAALIQCSPPDEHGYLSLGVAVDVVLDAVEAARLVIAQVNPAMPRTLGDSFLHVSQIDQLVEHNEALLAFVQPPPDDIARRVARQAARLVPDGATIHCGLGSVAQAVLAELCDHRDLGVHTDVLTDAYLAPIRSGAINGAAKQIYPHKIVASFCLGGPELFEFVNNNPMVEMQPTRLVNNPALIAQNPRMIAVHEALEVDLTGQVCSEAIGSTVYAGVGGMVDFLRGAAKSPGGRPLIVLPSTRPDGSSRVMASLSPGAGVSVTRAGVRGVATEYGVAQLHGLSVRERAVALIDIAHPNHRDALLGKARKFGLIAERQILAPLFTGIYPENYEQEVELKDQSQLLIRPVKPTDERMVQEFFYAMSDTEVYYRFLHAIKAFPQKDMQKMVNIDYHREMNLLALSGEFGEEQMAGLARYVLGEDGFPEIDFAVRTEFQGKGLGRVLMAALLNVAQERGYSQVHAYVTPENSASLGILKTMGYAVTGTVSRGVIEMHLHLDQPVDEPQVELKYGEQYGQG
jgi:acyl-CoA hydrolase/RimJ/RimL family protein N-acetyltransferase